MSEHSRQIYLAIRDSPGIISALRSRRIELASDITDDGKALEMTSFTLNGQSSSGSRQYTKSDLLGLIGRVLYQIDNGCALSTRTTGVQF